MIRSLFSYNLPRRFVHRITISVVMSLVTSALLANNIAVSNTSLVGQNPSDGSVMVQFDLSWENSWKFPLSTGINNWDAAWVFVKYRVPVSVGGDGLWKHARLYDSGHSGPGATFNAGLLAPGSAFNATSNPAVGVFISRADYGTGSFSIPGAQLRWNYDANGLSSTDLVEIRVFAIEMVYVPQGSFFVGSGGTESGSFTNGSWVSDASFPLKIASESELTIGPSAGSLWGTSATGNNTIGDAGTLPEAYPKGFSAFYSMKYEISQQQYVDFLNTLSYTQQNARSNAAPNALPSTFAHNQNRHGIRVSTSGVNASTPAVYETTFPFLANNWMSWMDGAAYLDWAGLRPMTELEFEKAARGPLYPVANGYAWANATTTSANEITNGGQAGEVTTTANANSVSANQGNVQGPMRVGVFAVAATTRAQAGASFYGIMEMSGNVREQVATVGNADGRAFLGTHGDGSLSSAGHANPAAWPGLVSRQVTGATGSGFRGGDWLNEVSAMRVSDRDVASSTGTNRTIVSGFRGVRSAGCLNLALAPTIDTAGGLSPIQAVAGRLLTYKVTGTESHLWVVPNNWQIVSGQGTNQIRVIIGETLPGSVRVAAANACGAGAETTIQIGPS